MKRAFCVLLTAVLGVFMCGISVNAEYTGEQSVIIEYSVDSTGLQEQIIERNFHSVEKVDVIDENSVAVFFSDGTDMDKVTEVLELETNVVSAEENYERQLHFTPNDPYYNGYQWALRYAKFPDSWDYSGYGEDDEIVVAVCDSGFYSHGDLSANLLPGYNVVENSTDITDYKNHGTIVAGVMGSITNNSSYVAGAIGNFNIKILPIKVFNDDANTIYTSDVIKGVEYAVANGADVINLSLGGESKSTTEETKYNAIIESGIPIIASSGNYAQMGNPVMYPASYDKVISVGSHDEDGAVSSFSCYNEYVDISAPGGSICGYGAEYDSETGTFSTGLFLADGTSFSAPHVSAAAAILKSIAPDLNGEDFEKILTQTATLPSNQTGRSDYYGWGYLNVLAAVEKLYEIRGAEITGGTLMGDFVTDKKEYTVNKTATTTDITPVCYAPISDFTVSTSGESYSVGFTNPKGVSTLYSFEIKQLADDTVIPSVYETDEDVVFDAASYSSDSSAISYWLVAARYLDEKLDVCDYLEITTNGKYDEYNITLDKTDNAVYKLFLWDKNDFMKPISDVCIYN